VSVKLIVHGAESGRFAGLAEIVLDRIERRNALTPDMLAMMIEHVRAVEADEQSRALVVRGEGSVFCAGFDLRMCLDDRGVLPALLRGLSSVVRAMRRLPKPVVVGAHGAAIAGGCALLGGADLVVTNQDAKLGYPVLPLGISPAVSAPTLAASVGRRAMRERLLDPALIDGQEARRIGLADYAVDLLEDVAPRSQIEAIKLGDKPPWAFCATKLWLNEIEGSDSDEWFDRALEASLSLVGSAEERERLAGLYARE